MDRDMFTLSYDDGKGEDSGYEHLVRNESAVSDLDGSSMSRNSNGGGSGDVDADDEIDNIILRGNNEIGSINMLRAAGAGYNEYTDVDRYKGGSEVDLLRGQLEQKDKDLMLAAELGKALLEKNAELEKKLESTIEDYSQQIEELEQERYGLHLKFENLQDEYETTVKELQYDLAQLRDQLDKHRQDSHLDEREKNKKIHTLAQQNERLLDELQQRQGREQHLEAEVQSLRDNNLASVSNKQHQQIEHLQEQVSSLTSRKSEVERRLEHVQEDKEALLGLLDETQDKVKVLERQKHDNETKLHQKDEEIRDLHERNSQLSLQVDQLTEKASNSSGHSMTLFNELSQLSGGNQDITMATDSPINPYPPSMFGDDDIECDDDDDYLMTSSSPTRYPEDLEHQHHGHHGHHLHHKGADDSTMEEEILQAYRHLRQLCKDIKSQMINGVEESEDNLSLVSSSDSSSLNGVVLELRDTIHCAIEQTNQSRTSQLSEIQSLQTRVEELQQDLTGCNASLQKIREQVHIRDIHLQQKNCRVNELARQVTSQQEDIKILSSQRDKLQDMLASDTGKPQMYSAMALLRHARRERDASVEKRYSLEKELQQSKYEVIVLNHQLMEAIHQKNKVSGLLDQWQSDMAGLLGVKMDASMLKSSQPSANETTEGAAKDSTPTESTS